MKNRENGVEAIAPSAWSVLMSPIRNEVAEALRILGPSSVAEIAEIIDRPADTLYRHLEILQEAGLVQAVGFRKLGRNAEQVFELTARDFVADFSGVSRSLENRTLHRAISNLLKATDRTVRDAAAAQALYGPLTATVATAAATVGSVASDPTRAGVAPPAFERPNLSLTYELGWLTPAGHQEVRALLERIKEIMAVGRGQPGSCLYMTLAVVSPVVRKRGAGGRDTPPAAAGEAAAPKAKKPRAKPTRDEETRAPRSSSRKSRATRIQKS
jgi:DNA-binding transcriptional ArsR family regulator